MHSQIGFSLPRTIQQIFNSLRGAGIRTISEAQPGDIMFIGRTDGVLMSTSFIGIYSGSNSGIACLQGSSTSNPPMGSVILYNSTQLNTILSRYGG